MAGYATIKYVGMVGEHRFQGWIPVQIKPKIVTNARLGGRGRLFRTSAKAFAHGPTLGWIEQSGADLSTFHHGREQAEACCDQRGGLAERCSLLDRKLSGSLPSLRCDSVAKGFTFPIDVIWGSDCWRHRKKSVSSPRQIGSVTVGWNKLKDFVTSCSDRLLFSVNLFGKWYFQTAVVS